MKNYYIGETAKEFVDRCGYRPFAYTDLQIMRHAYIYTKNIKEFVVELQRLGFSEFKIGLAVGGYYMWDFVNL